MKKKLFKILLLSLVVATVLTSVPAAASTKGQLTSYTAPKNAMYNGIVLPDGYEFRHDMTNSAVDVPPYLVDKSEGGYAPEVINIDRGRQLFVDDFLIESTDLTRAYYEAVKYEYNPVFYPETREELTGGDRGSPSVGATSGGLWYDMEDKLYKMWYESGWNGLLSYATSENGVDWVRPDIGGSNVVLRRQQVDSYVVWIDYDAPASEKYKLMVRSAGDRDSVNAKPVLYTSGTGTNWNKIGQAGPTDDRTTFFYNPFTKKWVFSIRASAKRSENPFYYNGEPTGGRYRKYHDGDTFLSAAKWDTWDEPVDWLTPDDGDISYSNINPMPKHPQIYNFDSIAYESLMIGMFEMWYGPENEYINASGWPKICEIQAGFSRDGFHYERPNRKALIPATQKQGTWDYGYLSPMGGGMIVYDNEIRIYYTGFSGYWYVDGERIQNPYAGGCIGYATLRRDGFASMNGTGTLTTKPLTVTKDVKYLFVNTNSQGGAIKAEILDTAGNVIEGYSAADCTAITDNTAKVKFTWKGENDLSMLEGKQFKVRFYLNNAQLYSFWLAPDELGTSGGEMAAGYIGEETPLPEQTVAYTTEPAEETEETEAPKKKGCKGAIAAPAIAVALTAVGTTAGAVISRKKKRSKKD
ncbi:MAG: glycosyl hydrolase family 32 [Clostridia bacterium]|nr:glycosyl hydrolase family 32 [Clostridia bacterium]